MKKDWKTYLAEIEAREQKATPGPWYVRYGYDSLTGARNDVAIVAADDDGNSLPIFDQENLPTYNSCEFIAESRTDIPRLTKRIRELEFALEFYANGCLYSEPAAEKMIAREVLNRGVEEFCPKCGSELYSAEEDE